MKFCPLFKRSCLFSFPITAQSVKGSIRGGWEEEGGAGYLVDSSEGFFFSTKILVSCAGTC